MSQQVEGVRTALSRGESGPEGDEVRGDDPWVPLFWKWETWYQKLARHHPLIARDLLGCVETSQVGETCLYLIAGFTDVLGRDWLPYSGD